MLVTNRDFQAMHVNSAGANVRGVFQVAGDYFKITTDILVPLHTGSGTVASTDIWDYAGPVLDANPSLVPPNRNLIIVTGFTVLWSTYGPNISDVLTCGGTLQVTLVCGKTTDVTRLAVVTLAGIVLSSEPKYVGDDTTYAMPPPSADPSVTSLTYAGIEVVATASITGAGYLRCVTHGQFI